MNSLTITLPLPVKEVSQNSRCHFMTKARATKEQRALAGVACLKAWHGLMPFWERASFAVVAYFKTKRHPDPMNFIGSLKATADGIEDAGIVANDSGLWPLRPVFATDKLNPRVVITITEEVAS
ncbi:hypothetical protein UFOVP813_6 [uncultured Caudovirales phage]|uniref:Uncharacterized protein n=1 Tax=uncultured Caudovirales phage TaxID=2100421 RepID=A0A6J5P1T7_9CAUD|nr:hypothetical protein UFOVP813_6 [uncultured Caudovirales phage]